MLIPINAVCVPSYCIGNIVGPQLFFAREKPRYESGFTAIIVCFAVQIFIISGLYVNSWRENRRVCAWPMAY